ncbi:MAG: ABC transporter ATP-binding protein [Burkholderiales bacterium]
MSVLSVQGLAKSYGGVQALRGVSFEVAAGEMVAMIGPNGAGKTTCFNLLNGQLEPDAGRILLDETDIAGLQPRAIWRLGVGRTFQVTATFGSLSVRENVAMALLSFQGKAFSFFNRKVDTTPLLSLVGIRHQADKPCAELAYGDLKRVELAMALANRPRLLLMDEPTAGMAAAERDDLMALAARLARDEKIAVLFTEHDMDVVFTHAHRVIVLAGGERIAEGPPTAVRADARVREIYLGTGDA